MTVKVPTENATAIDRGRIPMEDAFVFARLKAAGAIIMGKTVTTEMAYIHPPKTRNPWPRPSPAGRYKRRRTGRPSPPAPG